MAGAAPGCIDWATGPDADVDRWRFQLESGTFVSVVLGFLDEGGAQLPGRSPRAPGRASGMAGGAT